MRDSNTSNTDSLPRYGSYIAESRGMVGNGTFDNTNALQSLIDEIIAAGKSANIYFGPGNFLFTRGIQQFARDNNANSQIAIPRYVMTLGQIVINLIGYMPLPLQYFNVSPDPSAGFTTFTTTLTGTANDSFISGAWAPGTGYIESQNNVSLNLENIIINLPPNPSITGLSLENQQANRLKSVLIMGGTTNLSTISEPTNTNQYGLKNPGEGHTAQTILDDVRIMGCFYGMTTTECIRGTGVRLSANKRCIHIGKGFHPNVFPDLHMYWSPYSFYCDMAASTDPIQAMMPRINVLSYGIEHYGNEGGAAWMVNVADVYDPNNNIHGECIYTSVKGSVGNTPGDFIKTGGTNFKTRELGGAIA